MPRHERRIVQLDESNHRRMIPHNYRVVRGWTQEQAAAWYGCSVRSWRRYEHGGAPRPLLTRIAQWAARTVTGSDNALWLSWEPAERSSPGR
jgi:transcriptional regulator with XRE-family HTH domain